MEASAQATQASLVDDDALASLEERIRRAVELVTTLRAERDAAVEELESARKAAGSVLSDQQKLKQELETLRSERKQVKVRIEKLLGQMDLL
jgi:FtsZ-binding cell division protein ZapB